MKYLTNTMRTLLNTDRECIFDSCLSAELHINKIAPKLFFSNSIRYSYDCNVRSLIISTQIPHRHNSKPCRIVRPCRYRSYWQGSNIYKEYKLAGRLHRDSGYVQIPTRTLTFRNNVSILVNLKRLHNNKPVISSVVPAEIDTGGTQTWYMPDGVKRVVELNGKETWYKYGRVHRTDGPAIIHASGRRTHYLNDEYYPKSEWLDLVKT